MGLSITEDIHSIKDLERITNSALEQIHKTKHPVVLTVNGIAENALLATPEYKKIRNAFNVLKLLIPAEDDISNDRCKEANAFFKDFKCEKFPQFNRKPEHQFNI